MTTSRGPAILLALVMCLVAAAVAAVCAPGRGGRGEGLQRLVGGLGLGPALTPGRDAFRFDPRVRPRPTADAGPVPAGDFFTPSHGTSLVTYPPPAARRR